MSDPLNDALDRRDAIDPDNDSDEVIAAIIADILLWRGPPYYLSIFHDVHASALRKLKKMQETYHTNHIPWPVGPCALPYDWQYKNTVGIDARDRIRAKQWIIDAMLAGYSVFFNCSPKGRNCGGYSTIAEIREKARDRATRGRRESIVANTTANN